MKTKHYQSELALLAGDDLPESEAIEVYRHLATCPECRAHLQQLKKSQDCLSDYAISSANVPEIDLRERVQKSLPTQAQLQRRERLLHNWAPAATVVVACTLLFMVMGPQSNTSPVSTAPATSDSSPVVTVPGDGIGQVTFDLANFDNVAPEEKTLKKKRQYRVRPDWMIQNGSPSSRSREQ